MYDAIIFTDKPGQIAIGAYRLRSAAEEAGYNVKIIEIAAITSIEAKVLIKKFCTKKIKIIGISVSWIYEMRGKAFTSQKQIFKIIPWIKSVYPDVKIIIGGAGSAYIYHEGLDFRITGYADNSFISLLNYISNTNYNHDLKFETLIYDPYKTPSIIGNINSYNKININSINTVWKKEDYILPHTPLPIEISRGCIFKCSFCAFPLNGKKKLDYVRSVDKLVEEMQYNYETFGTTNYNFMDDTYNDGKFKLDLISEVLSQLNFKIKFISYIKPELLLTWPHHLDQLKEQGLIGCAMGIESFNSKTRMSIHKSKDFNKLLDSFYKMSKFSNNHVMMIGGLPYESFDDFEKSIDFLYKNYDIASSYKVGWLSIKHPDSYIKNSGVQSLMDINPEKYGYKLNLSNKKLWPRAQWTNKYMTSDEAELKATKLNNIALEESNRVGGFFISRYQHLNFNTDDIQFQKSLISELKSEFRSKSIELKEDYLKFQLSSSTSAGLVAAGRRP